jgi:predicted nucleic acid-binding protein
MIVSNTTPLSNFLHIERMDVLRQLFPALHAPMAVKLEIEEYFHENQTWRQCLEKKFIRIHQVRASLLMNHLLHPGETEALTLCLEQQADLCLLDDKDARIFAKLHGIKVTGTLGILLEAKKKGIIAAVRPLMDALRLKHSFWISEKMYQHVLCAAEELS